jgi:hypothetical protein
VNAIKETTNRSHLPDERFRATFSALARKDIAESHKLFDTCPEKTYRMPDAEYTFRLKKLMQIADGHRQEIYRLTTSLLLGQMMSRRCEDESEASDTAYRLLIVSINCLAAKRAAWEMNASGRTFAVATWRG